MDVIIDPQAFVCKDVELCGPHRIVIGKGSVLNPRCSIRATNGPIEIDQDNVIEELAVIENKSAVDGSVMKIGSKNIFQVGCSVAADSVGHMNVFEVKSTVDVGSTIGSGCVVGTTAHVESGAVMGDEAVAFRCDSLSEPNNIVEGKRLKEQNLGDVTRYLDILRNSESKSALEKHHEMKTM